MTEEKYVNYYLDKIKKVQTIFTPSRPVTDKSIFSGRTEQLGDCLSIVNSPGLHGILFGDRGVGKTSMSNIVSIFINGMTAEIPDVPVRKYIKVECSSNDTFEYFIKSIYKKIDITVENDQKIGFVREDSETKTVSLHSLTGKDTSYYPQDIAQVLRQIPYELFIAADEFDRLNPEVFKLDKFTDTLKCLSDSEQGSSTHFLVIGVGDNVNSILGSHASIERNLIQIKMSVMSPNEIKGIITNGMTSLDMTMSEELINRIADISCGYPHYTHLLSLYASQNALSNFRDEVSEADLEYSITKSIERASEGLKKSYRDATLTNKQNIYPEVIYACSICETDEYGLFQPKDIENHLSRILKRQIKVNQFGAHLIRLCKQDRGSILVQEGIKGRKKYRFKNPLMRAFVKLNGNRRTN
ncbi:hypothetical protein [Gluconobacter oxydans]|uniref:hypothetical protein n=1 Tax=Gluconobacter oxydans TaxID=442 RepID=UPI0039E8E5B6